MDEFVHYHALGCASAPRSRELPLDPRRLRLLRPAPALHERHRSRCAPTSTSAAFPALPFYPFWLLLDDPVAARVQGAVFFLLCGAPGHAAPARAGLSVVLAALVYPGLPRDVPRRRGPGRPLGRPPPRRPPRRAARPSPRSAGASSVAWAALAGFALFSGLWTKLVFAWWLPAVAVFALAEARSLEGGLATGRRPSPRSRRPPAWLALLLPTLVLLASSGPRRAALRRRSPPGEASRPSPSASSPWPAGSYRYVTDGSLVAPRNVVLPLSLLDPLTSSPSRLSVAPPRRAGGAERRRREVAGWAVARGPDVRPASPRASYSQWPHHFAFPLLLLVLALALAIDALSSRARGTIAVLVVAFWATLAARWPAAEFPAEASPAKDELLRLRPRARARPARRLQLHTSWGTYYIAQLFGDRDRMILYMRGATDDPARLRQVRGPRARGREAARSS